jgi:serine protease Do
MGAACKGPETSLLEGFQFMTRQPLFFSLCLLLALVSAVYGQQATTPRADQPEAHAFALALGGDNYLGVTTEDVTKETMSRYGLAGEPRGVAVLSVLENSPAARAGLQKGDVILRFDGEATTSVQKLQRLINEAAPEHAARLTFSRNGAEQEVTVTLARREGFARFEGFALQPGEGFQLNSEEWRKRGEDWQEHSEQWQKRNEELQQRMDELRKRLDTMPQQGNSFVLLGAGRRIGVTTTALTDQLADYFGVSGREGVLVTSVSENSPAAKAGLKAGDVITEADGEKVRAAGDLVRALNRHDDGEVSLNITRDKRSRTIKVVPERVQPTTIYGPATLVAPPIALTLPRVTVRTPRIVSPRMNITPRVIAPRLRRIVVL